MRRSMLALLAAPAALLALLPAVAAESTAPAATPAATPAAPTEVKTLACEGPFAADSSEAKMKEAFGDTNVVFKVVPGPEGTELNATVVFGDDPARMLTVYWMDEEKRQGIASIDVQADWGADPEGYDPWKREILWQSAEGIRVGSSIEEVEKANGKPFLLSGFDWDYGGYANSWEGGALEPKAGGCILSVRFSPSAAESPQSVSGDVSLKSDAADVRAAKPRVTQFSIGYPPPE